MAARGQFFIGLQAKSGSLGQEPVEKWTAQTELQPDQSGLGRLTGPALRSPCSGRSRGLSECLPCHSYGLVLSFDQFLSARSITLSISYDKVSITRGEKSKYSLPLCTT